MNPIEQQFHERLERIIQAHMPLAANANPPDTQSAFVVLAALALQSTAMGT